MHLRFFSGARGLHGRGGGARLATTYLDIVWGWLLRPYIFIFLLLQVAVCLKVLRNSAFLLKRKSAVYPFVFFLASLYGILYVRTHHLLYFVFFPLAVRCHGSKRICISDTVLYLVSFSLIWYTGGLDGWHVLSVLSYLLFYSFFIPLFPLFGWVIYKSYSLSTSIYIHQW